MNYVILPSPYDNNPDATYMINKWYVSAGSKVKAGDILVAYEEDKSVVDIYSEYDGTVTEIFVKDEEIVAPGTKICAIE